MHQRDLMLAIMSNYELRQTRDRFMFLRRMAVEMGAGKEAVLQWSEVLRGVELELELREQEDGDAPF